MKRHQKFCNKKIPGEVCPYCGKTYKFLQPHIYAGKPLSHSLSQIYKIQERQFLNVILRTQPIRSVHHYYSQFVISQIRELLSQIAGV